MFTPDSRQLLAVDAGGKTFGKPRRPSQWQRSPTKIVDPT
jgi:hypothetical protein